MSRPLIIERPSLQSRTQKYGQMSVALFMWVLWLWLWLPVLTLLLWALGVNLVITEFIVDQDLFEVFYTLLNFFSTVLFVVGVQYLWSIYNYIRFRNKARRHMTQPLAVERLACDHGQPLEFVEEMQAARFIDLQHDEEGNIIGPASDTSVDPTLCSLEKSGG